MDRKTKKDLEHELKIKSQTNKTLAGMLEYVKAHASKLEQYIEAGDLGGAQEYLNERKVINE